MRLSTATLSVHGFPGARVFPSGPFDVIFMVDCYCYDRALTALPPTWRGASTCTVRDPRPLPPGGPGPWGQLVTAGSRAGPSRGPRGRRLAWRVGDLVEDLVLRGPPPWGSQSCSQRSRQPWVHAARRSSARPDLVHEVPRTGYWAARRSRRRADDERNPAHPEPGGDAERAGTEGGHWPPATHPPGLVGTWSPGFIAGEGAAS